MPQVWASRVLLTQLPSLDGSISVDVGIDWRVLAFTVGTAVIAVVLFGTVPALYATRVPPVEALRDGGRGTGGRPTGLLSSGLVIAQVALSIVLIAGAGLFVRTVDRLVNVPLGFEPEGILVVSANTARALLKPPDPTQLHQRMLEAVAAVPGVMQAAGSVWTPVGTGGGRLLTDARGRRAEVGGQVALNFVTPGWFETYGTAVHTGRDFDPGDGSSAPRDALINEALRRRLLPDGQPLGSTIHAGPCGRDGCTVVGVVGRRAEIGIRLALGGQPQAVLRGMLKRIALFVAGGILLGLLASLWLSRFVAPLLYGLEPHDPVTLLASAATLASVAAVAGWIPAARATRIDPAQVLREN